MTSFLRQLHKHNRISQLQDASIPDNLEVLEEMLILLYGTSVRWIVLWKLAGEIFKFVC